MLKKHGAKIMSGALLGIVAAVVVWLLAKYFAPNLFYTYEAKTYDWRMTKKFSPDMPTIDDIIIVDIDERSNQKLGKYSQWPREYHSRLVKFLHDAGALAVGLDILYDPDTWHPEQDVEFVQTVKQSGNVYTALYFAQADSDNWRPVMTEEPAGFDAEKFYYQLPLPEIQKFRKEERLESGFFELLNAARGCGHVNFNADVDGVVRSIHLFTNFNNHLYPALAFKIFMDLIGTDSLSIDNQRHVISLFGQGERLTDIPVDEHGNMLINYVGPYKSFRYISFYDVLNAKERNLPPEIFENKIVLLGTSLAGLFDLRNVPFMQAFPGVEIHANIMYTLFQQNFIHRIAPWKSFLIMIALGAVIGILISYTGPVLSIILIVLAGLGYIVAAAMIFLSQNLWIEMITPILTLLFTFTFVYMYRYMTEERNKRFIRSTFSHFVTKAVVDELLANPDKIKLGGEKKVCTVMFSDVAGFTTISENLDPEELVHLLNEYLTEMTNIVFKYDGMLDKYEGDAIMAVFGAPIDRGNHAFNACATALDMQERLVAMREMWRKAGKPELRARIGINTGPMVVGNMGSETRFDYTVMGDAVNLGARLEPANKEYGTLIMIGEETYKYAGDTIIVRALDLLRVKGKNEPVKVYELLGTAEKGISDEMRRVVELFDKGFNYYLQQNWDWAIKYFQQALAIKPDDGPSSRYIARCEQFKQNPPGDDWDGVYTMKTK